MLPLPGRHRKDCLAVRPLASDWVPPPPTPPKRQLRERPHSVLNQQQHPTDPDTSLLDSSFASCVDDALLLSNLKVKGLHEELAGKREEIRSLSNQLHRARMDLAACHQVTAIRHTEERMLQSSWERPAGQMPVVRPAVEESKQQQQRHQDAVERAGKKAAALWRLQAILRPIPREASALWRWHGAAVLSSFNPFLEPEDHEQGAEGSIKGRAQRAALRQMVWARRRIEQGRMRQHIVVTWFRRAAAAAEARMPERTRRDAARALAMRHALLATLFRPHGASLARRCLQSLRNGWLAHAASAVHEKLGRAHLRSLQVQDGPNPNLNPNPNPNPRSRMGPRRPVRRPTSSGTS